MGHTNSTANLSLPQFIGTDKPTWLGDVNGAFSAIDSYAGTNDAAVAAAVSDASSAIAQAASAVNTANTANTTAGNASTAATNAVGTANNAMALVNQTNIKVGTLADLTTTDKTSIVNAINEVNGAIGTPTAAQVSYDNTGSGLAATDVQSAIDELAQGGGGAGEYVEVTADGAKTKGQLLDELYAAADLTKLTDHAVLKFFDACYAYSYESSGYWFTYAVASAAGISVATATMKASGSTMIAGTAPVGTTNAVQDQSSAVEASGHVIRLYY